MQDANLSPSQVRHQVNRWGQRYRQRRQHEQEIEEIKAASRDAIALYVITAIVFAALFVLAIAYIYQDFRRSTQTNG